MTAILTGAMQVIVVIIEIRFYPLPYFRQSPRSVRLVLLLVATVASLGEPLFKYIYTGGFTCQTSDIYLQK